MPISLFGKLRRGSCQKWINCSHIQPSHIKPQKLSLIIKHIRGLFAGLFSVYHSSGGKQAFISTYLLYQGHYFNVSLSEWLAVKISCVTYRVFVNVAIKWKFKRKSFVLTNIIEAVTVWRQAKPNQELHSMYMNQNAMLTDISALTSRFYFLCSFYKVKMYFNS